MRSSIQYLTNTFANSFIKSAQMAVDTSLNERTLDVDTMNATVKSATALTTFQQNTPVRLLRGGSQYALWFLSEITRVAPQLFALSMTSSLGRLTQMEHKGGVYNGVAASAVIADIMGDVPYYVSSVFANVLLYGWLPYVAPSGENGATKGSAKDSLLQVLFALNATVRDDAEGTLRIENLSAAVSSSIVPDRIYRDNAQVVYEPAVTAVTVLEHQYIAGGELTTLFEGTTTAGQVIVFDEPMSNLTATGFSVTASGANYAVVSAGSGTLTGRKYVHTTREITKPVATADVPNVARIEDATLVGVTNSNDVVNRLVEYYRHRAYINVDAVIDFEDAGDVVDIYDPFDKVMRQACIEKISPLIVSNTMKGRVNALVGFTPWQVTAFEDVHEIITASGTWTAPANLLPGTEITVVDIGGGDGATSGTDGEAGTAYPISGSFTTPVTLSTPNGVGGKGGVGGVHGDGGKIYRASMTVNPGQQVQVTIGQGGSSGGGKGGDTSFGPTTSADGASSDSGYYDPVTGTSYGVAGTDGVDGGDGGDGGSGRSTSAEGNDGKPGKDVGSNTGGVGGKGYYSYGSFSQITDGGGASGGGGAAFGQNGGNGFTPPAPIGTPQPGGSGANAAAPSAPANYGDGGNAGHGGGGGGGGGGWYYRDPNSGSSNTYNFNPQGGTAGRGSSGTAGRPGCVHLYYRVPVAA